MTDRPGRARTAWAGVGIVAAAIVGYVLYSFVGTIVVGIFLYYISRSIYGPLSRRLSGRALAASTSLVAVALPVFVLLGYTIAVALQEFSRLSNRVNFGVLERTLNPYVDLAEVVEDPASFVQDPNIADSVQPILDTVFASLGTVGNVLLHGFMMFALAYYLLKDGARLRRWFDRRFADGSGVLDAYLTAVDSDLNRVFTGNIANALFTAVIGALSYNLLNVVAPATAAIPYPTLLGVLTGAGSLIPVVGMKLVYVPVAGYLGATQFLAGTSIWWPVVAFVLVSFLVVDTIPDLVLRPLVSGGSLPEVRVLSEFPFLTVSFPGDGALHVGLIMFSYILGPLLFGWYGLFLGPMILVAITHFARLVLPEIISGERIQPTAIDPGALVGEHVPGEQLSLTDTPSDGGLSGVQPETED